MPKVTKAVIAAAGWSTRFLPSVKTYAKHLVPVWDRPNIQYQVEACLINGITDICIVHRPGEDTLKKHFQSDDILHSFLHKTNKTYLTQGLNHIIDKISFTFLPQGDHLPYGNATPLLVAKEFIGASPFFYFYGDDIVIEANIGSHLAAMLSLFDSKQAAGVVTSLLVDREQIQKYGSIKFRQDGSIEAIKEKPTLEEIHSLNAQVSPMLLSAKIVQLAESLPLVRGEIWCPDAINNLCKTDKVFACQVSDGHWATTGDPENWLLANIALAIKSKPELKEKIASLL